MTCCEFKRIKPNMNMNTNKKRKRTKLVCLKCGSTFDDDYKKKHELTQHGGEKVRVKHLGAPDNPFILASSKKKCTLDSTSMHNMEVVHIIFIVFIKNKFLPIVIILIDYYLLWFY